jgi:hypothetical protein
MDKDPRKASKAIRGPQVQRMSNLGMDLRKDFLNLIRLGVDKVTWTFIQHHKDSPVSEIPHQAQISCIGA